MPSGEVQVALGIENRARVLEYLIREADLDGVVVVSQREVGAHVGLSQWDVGRHIRRLVSEGALTDLGRIGGVQYCPIVGYQIAEDLL